MIYFHPQARPNHVITLRVGEKLSGYSTILQSHFACYNHKLCVAPDSRGSTVLKQAISVPGKNITLHAVKGIHNSNC